MDDDFRAAMRRTLEAVKTGDLSGATRILQGKLGGAPVAEAPPPRGEATILPPGMPDPLPGQDNAFQTLFDKLRGGLTGLADCTGLAQPGAEAPAVPSGSEWSENKFIGPQGSRDYRLFIPSGEAERAKGLLLMLHGCKQNPEDFARGTGMLRVAEEEGLILVFPAQPRIANMSGCWNWFEPGHQSADLGEPGILAGLTRSVAAEYHIPADRIFAAGLSAGGAMVAILADADPGLFAAIGIHSGLPAGAAHDVASAFAAMDGRHAAGRPALRDSGPRIILFHGDADGTVAVGNADRLMGRSDGRREEAVTPGGRHYSRRILAGPDGRTRAEDWRIAGGGHAWSGGSPEGSYTDPAGPDASREMVRFFLRG